MGDASDNIPGVAGVGEKDRPRPDPAVRQPGRRVRTPGRPGHQARRAGKAGGPQGRGRVVPHFGRDRLRGPVETAPGSYKRGAGDPAAAAALLAELEIHSLVGRLGLSAAPVPTKKADAAPPLPRCSRRLCPCWWRAGCTWPARGRMVRCAGAKRLARARRPPARPAGGRGRAVCVRCKTLYRLALEAGGVGKAIRFDAKLAAYLLNPAASGYTVEQLEAEYAVSPPFPAMLCPRPGRWPPVRSPGRKVAAEGMTHLLNDIELPLALVLADMERTGMLVDRAGLVAFGEELKAVLEQCLARIYAQVGYEFNLNSPKQLGEALFVKWACRPAKRPRAATPPMPKLWKACGPTARRWRTSCNTALTRNSTAPTWRGCSRSSGRMAVCTHLQPDRGPHRAALVQRAQSAEHPHPHRAGQPPAPVLFGKVRLPSG